MVEHADLCERPNEMSTLELLIMYNISHYILYPRISTDGQNGRTRGFFFSDTFLIYNDRKNHFSQRNIRKIRCLFVCQL